MWLIQKSMNNASFIVSVLATIFKLSEAIDDLVGFSS